MSHSIQTGKSEFPMFAVININRNAPYVKSDFQIGRLGKPYDPDLSSAHQQYLKCSYIQFISNSVLLKSH